jgi:hypothetical protein
VVLLFQSGVASLVKALVPFRSSSPKHILRQRFRSTDGLVGSTLCAAHTMTGIQALPHTHIECIRATSHFEHQARMLDPHGFAAVTAATEDADIYDWLQWKLRHGLSTWKNRVKQGGYGSRDPAESCGSWCGAQVPAKASKRPPMQANTSMVHNGGHALCTSRTTTLWPPYSPFTAPLWAGPMVDPGSCTGPGAGWCPTITALY